MSDIRHLNLETARLATDVMYNEYMKIRDAHLNLLGETAELLDHGGWTGPARDEFAGLWEEWKPRIGAMVSDLGGLQLELGKELSKWISMTEKFGDRSV